MILPVQWHLAIRGGAAGPASWFCGGDAQHARYLKRAAVLLFHPDPERFVTSAFLKIGFFRTNTDLLCQDEIHGDLFTQVEKTMDLLLTKYLKAGINYQGIQRFETFPVPEPALREAVLNAITDWIP